MSNLKTWLLFALLLLPLTPGAFAQNRAAELLLNKARLLEARGRIDLAAQTWQQILATEPEQEEALAGMARAAKSAGHEEEARGYLNRLKRANPKSPLISQIENIGAAKQQNGRLAEAARLVQAGKNDQAMAIYREVFGSTPPPEWAISYYETDSGTPGGWERATQALRTLVNRFPDSEAYRLSLGKLLTYRPATRLAGIDLLENIKSGSYEKQAQSAWRQALVWENGSRASVVSLRNYQARFQDSGLDALLKSGEKQASAPQPGPGPVGPEGRELALAYAALKANRLEEAEKGFQNVLKTAPKNGQALAGLGYVQMKRQDFAPALSNFEQAKAEMPGRKDLNDAIATSHFWLYMKDAAEALKQQRAEQAQDLFRKALALRPQDQTALEGYAGALMQHGDLAAATPILENLVRADPNNAQAWRTLVTAKYQKAGAPAALDMLRKVPAAVAAKLNQDLAYLIVLVSLYKDAGQATESRRAFQQASALAASQKNISEGDEIQLANLYLQYDQAEEAAVRYRSLIDKRPENLEAWEGLMLSLERLKDYRRAARSLEELPAAIRPDALARPGFLRAVASIQKGLGNVGSAEILLGKALAAESVGGATPSFYTQFQLAQVWMEQGQRGRAIAVFRELTKTHPDNLDSWKGLVLGLHQDGRDQEALDVAATVPAELRPRLQDDPNYLGLVASIYTANGQNEPALRLMRQAVTHYQGSGETVPADLAIQYGWLLMGDAAGRRALYLLLQDLRARADLPSDQRQTTSEILSTWVLQSADTARTAGDSERSAAILEAGLRAIPSDQRIRRALAGELLASGNPHRALALYKNAGLKNASAADYVAAVGTALAERDPQIATAWLVEGLRKYPNDSDLLNMAGREAAAKGDYKRAELFFRRALQATQAEERTREQASLRSQRGGADSPTGTDELGSLLLGGASAAFAGRPARINEPRPKLRDGIPWLNESFGTGSPSMPIPKPRPPSLVPLSASEPSAGREDILIDTEPPAVAPGSLLAVATGRSREAGWITEIPAKQSPSQAGTWDAPATATLVNFPDGQRLVAQTLGPKTGSMDQDITSLIDSLQPGQGQPGSRALPGGAVPQSSDPVMDLLKGQAPVGATLTPGQDINKRQQIEDEIKVLEDRNAPYLGMGGAFLSRSGQPGFDKMTVQESDLEATTILGNQMRVGLLLRGIFLNSPAPNGTSTLRFGLLPAGDTFGAQSTSGLGAELQLATPNFGLHVGSTPQSFLVRNWIGGFRFRPGSGPITIQFDRDSVKETVTSYAGSKDPLTNIRWGGVVANTASLLGNWGNEKSGTYFSTSFEYLTGKNVQTNERIDGTLGAYWRLVAVPAGSLTAGINLFAMHYTNNIRYFTYGQGGYFSPQRFVLFGVPINWTGKWRALQYTVSTSIGSQAFAENASPFFPTAPALQGKNGSYYPSYSSSGVNYNVDARLAYQLSPNWYIAGYINANNANFYTLQTIGVTVRYAFKDRPLSPQFAVPTIPDWRGKQPFGLP